MYAIFKAQGKQFRAVEDAVLRIPSLEAEPGDKVTFDDVLLAERDGDVHVGSPSVKGASVEVKVLSHGRGEKIIVYKMKRRKGYRKKQGHRQGYTEIQVTGIELPSGKPVRPEAPKKPKAEAKPAKEEKKAAPKAEKPVEEVVEAKVEEAVVEPAVEEVVEAAEEVVEETPAEEPEAQAEAAEEPAAEEPAAEAEAPAADDIDITDAAREMAEAAGLDLAAIEGTGKDGRILKGDVTKAIKAKEGD